MPKCYKYYQGDPEYPFYNALTSSEALNEALDKINEDHLLSKIYQLIDDFNYYNTVLSLLVKGGKLAYFFKNAPEEWLDRIRIAIKGRKDPEAKSFLESIGQWCSSSQEEDSAEDDEKLSERSKRLLGSLEASDKAPPLVSLTRRTEDHLFFYSQEEQQVAARASSVDPLLAQDEEEQFQRALAVSLVEGQQAQVIGLRKFPGAELEDVPDDGNCFFHAIVRELEKIKHPDIINYRDERKPLHEWLREQLNGGSPGQWVGDEMFEPVVRQFRVVLAVADTCNPEAGFTCYYLDGNGELITNPDSSEIVPEDRFILRIAATRNHFLCFTSHGAQDQGALRKPYRSVVNSEEDAEDEATKPKRFREVSDGSGEVGFFFKLSDNGPASKRPTADPTEGTRASIHLTLTPEAGEPE